MFNILFVNPNIKLHLLDSFIRSNKDNFNAIFISTEFFLKLTSISESQLRCINTFITDVGPLFNNSVYKFKAPISSNEFTNIIIENKVSNGMDNNNILSLLWHYDIQIFLLDSDRLNCLISKEFNHLDNLLSNAVDSKKITNIINVLKDDLATYYLSDNFDMNWDSAIFDYAATKYVDPKDVINLTPSDTIALINYKVDYSDLF